MTHPTKVVPASRDVSPTDEERKALADELQHLRIFKEIPGIGNVEIDGSKKAAILAALRSPVPATRLTGEEVVLLDRYGIALMMISQGCSDPIGVADKALAKKWRCKVCGWQGEMPNTKTVPDPMGTAQAPCCPDCDQLLVLSLPQQTQPEPVAWRPGQSIEDRARALLEIELNNDPMQPTLAGLRAIAVALQGEATVIDALRDIWDEWIIANDESGMDEYEIKDVSLETIQKAQRALRGRLYASHPVTQPEPVASWRGSEQAVRNLIAKEIWRYQECEEAYGPFDSVLIDRSDPSMKNLIKQTCLDQAEMIRGVIAQSSVLEALFRHKISASHPESPAATLDLTNHHNALLCPYCNPDGLKLSPAATGMREATIEECAVAAREAFDDAMRNWVMIGPGGLGSRMINAIRALAIHSPTGSPPVSGEGK